MRDLLTASLLLLAMSCGSSSSHTHSTNIIEIDGAPGAEVEFSGMTLILDESIKYRGETRYDSETGSWSEFTLNDMVLAYKGTTLHIGDTRVERVSPGDKIELGKAGIQVNGELRSPMPGYER